MIKFGKNLKVALKRKGISSKQLAATVGVRPNTISNYITGVSTPSYEILQKILVQLNISSDDLLFKDFESSPGLLTASKKIEVEETSPAKYNIKGGGRTLREDELVSAYHEIFEDFMSLKDRILAQQNELITALQRRI